MTLLGNGSKLGQNPEILIFLRRKEDTDAGFLPHRRDRKSLVWEVAVPGFRPLAAEACDTHRGLPVRGAGHPDVLGRAVDVCSVRSDEDKLPPALSPVTRKRPC